MAGVEGMTPAGLSKLGARCLKASGRPCGVSAHARTYLRTCVGVGKGSARAWQGFGPRACLSADTRKRNNMYPSCDHAQENPNAVDCEAFGYVP